MRHLVEGRKLNRTASHRQAMLSNMAVSILDKERITTTLAKAKEVRRVVERLITYGKKGNLHAIRLAERKIKDKNILKKLFDDIAPGYKEREGGYTRIIKLGERKGDNAPMSIIELTGRGNPDAVRKKKKKSKAKKPAATKASARSASESKKAGKAGVVSENAPEGTEIKDTSAAEEQVKNKPNKSALKRTSVKKEKKAKKEPAVEEEKPQPKADAETAEIKEEKADDDTQEN
jgi:large subunit ribosomal protein L17